MCLTMDDMSIFVVKHICKRDTEYVLLPDLRGGKMDSAAHGFSGREEEVFRITLNRLKRHGFNP